MKTKKLLLIITLSMVLGSCITTNHTPNDKYIIYDLEKAILYFKKSDIYSIISRIEKERTSLYTPKNVYEDDFISELLKGVSFIKSKKENIILSIVGYQLIYLHNSNIKDLDDAIGVMDVVDQCAVELLSKHKVKVYDKKNKRITNYNIIPYESRYESKKVISITIGKDEVYCIQTKYTPHN